MYYKTILFLSLLVFFTFATEAYATNPVATDSRIRTYVYGENEVFQLTTEHGYQSNIEFGPNEEIQTLSVGDPVAWKITPAGNRLFVRANEENKVTNLTVVTNTRAYQFQLSSIVEKDEDIVYVVRFFYPEVDFDSRKRTPETNAFSKGTIIENSYNFNYSLTGPGEIAPIQVFDDGKFTFFKFPNNNLNVPNIFTVGRKGNEIPLVSREDGSHIVVENVYKQFSLRLEGNVVCVFNDNLISRSNTRG